jgi:hypothetical protein
MIRLEHQDEEKKMKNLTYSLLFGLAVTGCTEDKGIDSGEEGFEIEGDSDSDADSEGDADADADSNGGGASGPFVPAAIGIEFSGIWDEEAGTLNDYVNPGELSESGEPTAYSAAAVVTLATVEYFGAESDAEREGEFCQWLAYFGGAVVAGSLTDPVAYDMNAMEFDWETGAGGTGTLIEEWAAWEGGLVIAPSSMDDRCLDWEDGSPDLFHGMHYGLGLGPLSSYMTTTYEDTDWWDATTDPYSYLTMYTAMNHPNSESTLGYDFVGYDFSIGLYVEADPDSCAEVLDADGEVAEVICGEFQIEDGDEAGSYQYKLGDHREDVGSRYAYIRGDAWWYEDFPNLDLNQMKEGFEFDAPE